MHTQPFSTPRAIAGAAGALAILLGVSPAAAQEIAIANEASLPRLDASGAPVTKRPLDERPEGVSRADCLADQRIRLPVRVTGFAAADALEAWASLEGIDCAALANRQGPSAACARLGALPLAMDVDFDVAVRSLLAIAPPFSVAAPATGDAACGRVDRTRVSVQILLFRAGDPSVPVASKTILLDADTVGPPAPTITATRPGAGAIVVEWEPPGGAHVSETTGAGLFSEPSTTDAGACASTTLHPGEVPGPEVKPSTRVLGATLTSAEISGLDAGGRYAVAVASTDDFGNVGPLSDLVCETPEAGTQGSSCSAAPPGSPPTTSVLVAVALAAIVARVRARQGAASASSASSSPRASRRR